MAIRVEIQDQVTFTVTITGSASDRLFTFGEDDPNPEDRLRLIISEGLGVDPEEVDPPLPPYEGPF